MKITPELKAMAIAMAQVDGLPEFEMTPPLLEHYCNQVAAALTAIREPTEGMRRAALLGWCNYHDDADLSQYQQSSETRAAWARAIGRTIDHIIGIKHEPSNL